MNVARIVQLVLGKNKTLVSRSSISTPFLNPQSRGQGDTATTNYRVKRASDIESLQISGSTIRDKYNLLNERDIIIVYNLKRSVDSTTIARFKIIKV